MIKNLAVGMLALLVASSAGAQVTLRVMPPNRAQFLQNQKFDVRVELTGPAEASAQDLKVMLDGRIHSSFSEL